MQLSIILARTNQGRFAKHTNKTHSPDKPARERARFSLRSISRSSTCSRFLRRKATQQSSTSVSLAATSIAFRTVFAAYWAGSRLRRQHVAWGARNFVCARSNIRIKHTLEFKFSDSFLFCWWNFERHNLCFGGARVCFSVFVQNPQLFLPSLAS